MVEFVLTFDLDNGIEVGDIFLPMRIRGGNNLVLDFGYVTSSLPLNA